MANFLRVLLITLTYNLNLNPAYAENKVYRSSDDIQEMHIQAADFYRHGKDQIAIELWQKVVDLDPKHIEAWQNIAVVQSKSFKDIKSSEATLRNAIKYNKRNAALKIDLAKLLEEEGQLKEAMETLNTVIDDEPKNIIALNIRGLLCFRSNDLDCAIRDLEEVKRLSPNYSAINFNLGLIYEKLGRDKEAVLAFEEETKLSPLNSEAFGKMGDSLVLLKDNDNAIKAYKKAVAIEPKLSWPYYNMGVLFQNKKNWSDAIHSYETFLKFTPQDPHANSNLGLIYLELNKLEQAKKFISEAVQFAPEQAHFSFNYGLVWQRLGCPFQAITNYQKSLKINPQLSFALDKIKNLALQEKVALDENGMPLTKDLELLKSKSSQKCK